MADVQIDVSAEEDAVTVENVELSYITVSIGGLQVEMRWEQAEALFNALRPFFTDAEE